MRGFGLSEKPLDGTYQSNYTLQLQADIYEGVAREEGLTSVVLVAHDMGQSVGLELMARQEEGRLPFRIRHAILTDGSTLVDMIQLAEMQKKLLAQPDVAATEDLNFDDFMEGLRPTFGSNFTASGGLNDALVAQATTGAASRPRFFAISRSGRRRLANGRERSSRSSQPR
jgi:pimeloyl-ACP methyl ester carboxylesterase